LAKSSTLVASNGKTPVAVAVYVGWRRSESNERSRRGRTSETSWWSSAKYDGARPFRHW